MPLFNARALGGSGSGGIIYQTIWKEVTANSTTTGLTFVTMDALTQAITLAGGTDLLIYFQASVANNTNNQQVYMRILVDAVVQRGCGVASSGAGNPGAGTIVLRVSGLSAGAHTVTVQWRASSAGSIAQCRPVANPDGESGSLVLQEISP